MSSPASSSLRVLSAEAAKKEREPGRMRRTVAELATELGKHTVDVMLDLAVGGEPPNRILDDRSVSAKR